MIDACEEERKASLKRLKIRAPEKKRHEWATRVWRLYKQTPHDIALLWDQQDGMCALCRQPLDSPRVWVIDHDHKTEKTRGLLHSWCNHRVLSMIERGGFIRAWNALWYLWPEQTGRSCP